MSTKRVGQPQERNQKKKKKNSLTINLGEILRKIIIFTKSCYNTHHKYQNLSANAHGGVWVSSDLQDGCSPQL
jgi:hypothetical protein